MGGQAPSSLLEEGNRCAREPGQRTTAHRCCSLPSFTHPLSFRQSNNIEEDHQLTNGARGRMDELGGTWSQGHSVVDMDL